jgi:transcription antitermination factor NusG
MALTIEGRADKVDLRAAIPGYDLPRWYAVYTSANHEKRVAEQMAQRSVEHFLPQYASVRRWKDRRKQLDLPLFPGYVFVRLALRDRLRVLKIPSVVRLVSFGGQPAALPDETVMRLREGLSSKLQAEPHPYLTVGRRVRILRGSLVGAEGILLRRKSGFRVVLSVELIHRSIAVEVDVADTAPIA